MTHEEILALTQEVIDGKSRSYVLAARKLAEYVKSLDDAMMAQGRVPIESGTSVTCNLCGHTTACIRTSDGTVYRPLNWMFEGSDSLHGVCDTCRALARPTPDDVIQLDIEIPNMNPRDVAIPNIEITSEIIPVKSAPLSSVTPEEDMQARTALAVAAWGIADPEDVIEPAPHDAPLKDELRFIVSYLGHNDQDADHAWVVRRIRAVLANEDPSTVEPREIRRLPPLTHVAIRFRDQIWSLPRPFRHHDVIRLIARLAPNVTFIDSHGDDQGFLDADGSYLTRAQALVNATSSGQLRKPLIGTILTSEDLW